MMDLTLLDKIESIEFRDVTFKHEGSVDPIFEKMSFVMPLGKNVLIAGESGSGQSTLLNILAGLRPINSGQFLLNGLDVAQMSFEEFLPLRLKIGYSFDIGGLFANRTLLANLTLPLLYHKILSQEEADERAMKYAEEFHFKDLLERRPAAVSGGMRKLVCVLRAFMLEPQVAILDEPFTGLDTDRAKKFVSLVERHREKHQLQHLFFTSRDEAWRERLSYESISIENGQIFRRDDSHVLKKAVGA